MNLVPTNKTVSDILSGENKQYIIPRFQREYSWDKKNYEEFLKDILNAITIEKGIFHYKTYFLGNMLFIGDFTEKKEKEMQVIDGQQRLTTITILFSAMSDIFKEIGTKVLSEKIFKYVANTDDDGNLYGVLKTSSSFPYFNSFIQDYNKEIAVDAKTEEEICIKDTYNYFKTNLSFENLKNSFEKRYGNGVVQADKYQDILKCIRDVVLSCQIIAITTKDRKEANAIFEILNAKGKRLASIDLIKNKIFEVLQPTRVLDFAQLKWDSIRDILFPDFGDSVPFGTFYKHYWASKYKNVAVSALYDSFKEQFDTTSVEDYKKFLTDLESCSKFYMNIVNPLRKHYQNKQEYYWLVQTFEILKDYFGVTQVRVALLPLLIAKTNDGIEMKKFKETVLFLEHFSFAYTSLLSRPSNALDVIYSKFSVKFQLCGDKASRNKVIDEDLIAPLKGILPTFNDFESSFKELCFSKKKNPSNMNSKYVIYKLNSFYSEEEIFPVGSSIEHIYSESKGDEALNIGNLILLEEKLNVEADSKEVVDKLGIYSKSKYTWVSKFIQGRKDWTPAEFEARAKSMARTMYADIFKWNIA